MAPVGYLVARPGADLAPSGVAYDYLLAGNGVLLRAENPLLRVCVPVASGRIRGLPVIRPAVELRHGRLPAALFDLALQLCRRAAGIGCELLCVATWDEGAGYRLLVPEQRVSASAVRYRRLSGVLLELHGHHRLPAFFSAADDADEQGLGLYGVLGRLDRPRPELLLRAGAYGAYLPLPWEAVFDGPCPCRDLAAEAPEGDGDGLDG